MSRWEYPRYVSVAEKKAKAEQKLKQLRKKRPDIRPVVVEGNTLARTWWGRSWNKNLERYADYSNRIGRGRSYVRHGAVLDLKIEAGKVTALVQGAMAKPYEVVVTIKPLRRPNWLALKNACEGRLKSLQDLLAGKFPKDLDEIFFSPENGLFPDPQAISFQCSCPDWASMCKHVAATLYGVGARLDEEPALFFKLRGVESGELIARAVRDRTVQLLEKTKKKSARVIDDADLSGLFGIDMDPAPSVVKGRTKPLGKGSGTAAKTAVQPRGEKNRAEIPRTAIPRTAIGQVAQLIAACGEPITMDELVERTGYAKTKLYGIVHRLKQQKKIKNRSHGVYERA